MSMEFKIEVSKNPPLIYIGRMFSIQTVTNINIILCMSYMVRIFQEHHQNSADLQTHKLINCLLQVNVPTCLSGICICVWCYMSHV